jgi:hypothetical protein
MATTTPNFGWSVPTSTDLVKNGASAIETLGDAIDATLGDAWVSYTPTFTNFVLGNGTISAFYKQVGKVVHTRGIVNLGSTSSVSGSLIVTLPVTAVGLSVSVRLGVATIGDSGTAIYEARVTNSTTTAFSIGVINVSGTYATTTATTSLIPMTWTTNDNFCWNFTYQAA